MIIDWSLINVRSLINVIDSNNREHRSSIQNRRDSSFNCEIESNL
jgi:hypothetical protein